MLTLEAWSWYVLKSYGTPNDVSAVHWVEQVLVVNPKGVDTIFLGYLNARLGEPHGELEEELAMALADHGLEDITRKFTPRHWYRGWDQWKW